MLEGVWDVKWEVSFGAGCIRLLFFFSGHSGPFRSQTWPLPGECQWAHGWYLSGTRVLGRGGLSAHPGDAGFRGFPSEAWRESNAEFSCVTTAKWCSMMFVCGLNGPNFYTAQDEDSCTSSAFAFACRGRPHFEWLLIKNVMLCHAICISLSVWALHRMST